MPKPGIRYDIFSVKQFDHAINDWCHVLMTTDRAVAFNQAEFFNQRGQTKVVHPAQWVINGYLAAGNTIS